MQFGAGENRKLKTGLRTVNETFSPEEFSRLVELKGEQTWHDYIIRIANRAALQDEAAKHIRVTKVEQK